MSTRPTFLLTRTTRCLLTTSLTCLLMTSLSLVHSFSQSSRGCDVVVAGGSTAALAAAIAAARELSILQVCLTEPSDWLGGQLTAGGVPAVDYGKLNRQAGYQPRDFADMMASVGAGNPGSCWVSTKCFLPRDLVEGWMARAVSELGNLHVLYRTVIKRVHREGRTISSIDAIQRSPRPGQDPWSHRLSTVLEDWYSEEDSAIFTKTLIRLEGLNSLVVVDATEYGDVLVLAGTAFHQGVETPMESSTNTLDTCGQAFTFTFYIQNENIYSSPVTNVPSGSPGAYDTGGKLWGEIWSYRRVRHPAGNYHESNPGDISNQNWNGGNDYRERYFFLSVTDTQRQTADWKGGVNMAALREAEDRAFGWFNFYVSQAPENIRSSLTMAGVNVSGTSIGLSMVPYLRDSRRSVGIDEFLLRKLEFDADLPGTYGVKYPDTVALGDYLYTDVHRINRCSYPLYLTDTGIKSFYIPFRSLTNNDVDNLLVAGKTMAVTFQANAATRMHPVEWNTGQTAGVAAAMMADERMTSRQIYEQVTRLQDKVLAYTTLDWNFPRG